MKNKNNIIINNSNIPLDEEIMPILLELNKKGYKTIASCQGHTEKTKFENRVNIYLTISNEKPIPYFPEPIKKKGNKPYTQFKESKPHSTLFKNCVGIYYFTSRKCSDEQKEKERKKILNDLLNWAKEI